MQDNNNQEAGNRIDTVSSYLDISNIPEDLGRRVRRYYRHYFSKKTALDECLVLDDLSASLRLEVSSFLVHDMLLNDVMIFKLVNPIHWAGLLPLLRPCIFNKDEVGWLVFYMCPILIPVALFIPHTTSCFRGLHPDVVLPRRVLLRRLYHNGWLSHGLEQQCQHGVFDRPC